MERARGERLGQLRRVEQQRAGEVLVAQELGVDAAALRCRDRFRLNITAPALDRRARVVVERVSDELHVHLLIAARRLVDRRVAEADELLRLRAEQVQG